MSTVQQTFFPLHLVPDPHPRVQSLAEILPLSKTAVIETYDGKPVDGYDMLTDLFDSVDDAVKYACMLNDMQLASNHCFTSYRIVTPRRWRQAQ